MSTKRLRRRDLNKNAPDFFVIVGDSHLRWSTSESRSDGVAVDKIGGGDFQALPDCAAARSSTRTSRGNTRARTCSVMSRSADTPKDPTAYGSTGSLRSRDCRPNSDAITSRPIAQWL